MDKIIIRDRDDMWKFVNSESKNKKVFVAFSGGKDAWCTYIECVNHGYEVIPYYAYTVPGLEFVENYLEYAEKKMGTHIYRFPTPAFFKMMFGLVGQTFDKYKYLESCDTVLDYDFDDIVTMTGEASCTPAGTWTALGLRASDSPRRRLFFSQYGVTDSKRHRFFPIFDYAKVDILATLKKHDITLPVDYRLFGRSFDGLYLLYTQAIKKYFPKDYKRLEAFFPLLDMEIKRYEFYKKRTGRSF